MITPAKIELGIHNRLDYLASKYFREQRAVKESTKIWHIDYAKAGHYEENYSATLDAEMIARGYCYVLDGYLYLTAAGVDVLKLYQL